MVDPATALLIATAVSTAAKGVGSAISGNKAKKAAKMKTKQMQRETRGGLLQDAQQRAAELEGHRLSHRAKSGKRSSESMQNTADLVRGAFNI